MSAARKGCSAILAHEKDSRGLPTSLRALAATAALPAILRFECDVTSGIFTDANECHLTASSSSELSELGSRPLDRSAMRSGGVSFQPPCLLAGSRLPYRTRSLAVPPGT